MNPVHTGFIEKCAELGVPDLDTAAHLLALHVFHEKQALDRQKLFRKKPVADRTASISDIFDTGIEDLPSRYGGMGMGASMGAGLGTMLGQSAFDSPVLGGLIGTGLGGFLGERYGQDLLAKLMPGSFVHPTAYGG